ncbi:MAG: hypothetical protein M1327_04865 [Candidatus Thermoplasmatota archaeon]|nr:hypothetical protein [Candidatus Thermoplasmatota archaeon]
MDGLAMILWLALKCGDQDNVKGNSGKDADLRVARKITLIVFLVTLETVTTLNVMRIAGTIYARLPCNNPYLVSIELLSGFAFLLWLIFLISRNCLMELNSCSLQRVS